MQLTDPSILSTNHFDHYGSIAIYIPSLSNFSYLDYNSKVNKFLFNRRVKSHLVMTGKFQFTGQLGRRQPHLHSVKWCT